MVRGVTRDRVKSRRQGGFAVVGAPSLVTADQRSRVGGDSDENQPSLTALLFHELFDVEVDGKTRAQTLVEALITKATDGDIRAYQEIFIRIDGDGKSRETETVATAERPDVDELTAQKILDVYDDYREAQPRH